MTQKGNPFLDQMAKFMTDGASMAQGMQKEAQTFFKTQIEQWARQMELVNADQLDVVRAMAIKAREENELLRARVEKLENMIAAAGIEANVLHNDGGDGGE
jgi:BMFP domain-containing protein YqiC